jgi:hypothetical protein
MPLEQHESVYTVRCLVRRCFFFTLFPNQSPLQRPQFVTHPLGSTQNQGGLRESLERYRGFDIGADGGG